MKFATSFDELYSQIKLRKVPFFIAFFVIVFLTYAFLFAIDFIPEPVSTTPQEEREEDTLETSEIIAEEEEKVKEEVVKPEIVSPVPLKIIFDDLDKEVVVLNPKSRNVADLDTALLSGAVRHPDSADFDTTGNIFILGHSSYLPNVMNKNFQAFNGIQKLVWGDTIRLESEDTEYIYRVNKVYEAKTSEVFVPQTPGKAMLTLATCNSFGTKDDRFMVEAVLIDTKPL